MGRILTGYWRILLKSSDKGARLVTIIVRADSPDEIGIEVTESGIRLRFEAQSGDRFLIELGDEVVGYVIAQLVYYAWNTTVEEAFGDGTALEEKETSPDVDNPALPDIPF